MFSNDKYGMDCITWRPDGRITQIEYAMEAVNQGSATVGLRSKKYAVLCSFNRKMSELASPQKKIFKIDDHIGIGVSGLTVDSRFLSNFMRNECLREKYVFEEPLKVGRLMDKTGEKLQSKTCQGGGRPYGVGVVVAGHDETGCHIYQTCPSGNIFEYYAIAIGGRCQSAKTYLEKNFETFSNADVPALVKHAIKALSRTTEQDVELTADNTSIGIVGEDMAFKLYTPEELQPYIEALKNDEGNNADAMDTSG